MHGLTACSILTENIGSLAIKEHTIPLLLLIICICWSAIDIYPTSSISQQVYTSTDKHESTAMYAIAILCYIMAMGMALPSQMAVSEDFKAEVQCHLRAPS